MSLVKAKTPKVILYSSRAKCLLMENGPDADFEAIFYSGWKLVKSQSNLILTEPHGPTSTYSLSKGEPLLDRENTRELWYHLKECLLHCERIEAGVNQLAALPVSNGSLPFFPMTIGRKPVTPPSAGVNQLSSSSNKENRMMMSEPVLSGLRSFDGSLRNSSTASSCKSSSTSSRKPDKLDPVTQTADVPRIGRALQKLSG